MSRASRVVRTIAFDTALIVAVLIAPWAIGQGAPADELTDWPGFRGAHADGVSTETGVFAQSGVRLDVAWKRPLGKGYSGVSVAQGRVVTMFSDGQFDLVIALDAASGRELWRCALDDTYKGHDGSQDGPISTPYIAAGHVYALAPRGKLVALNANTGQIVWKTDLIRDLGAAKPHWGFGTSPLLNSDVLVIQVGAPDAMVCGFEPKTGKRLWSAGNDEVYYQSPVPFRQAGRVQLAVAGNKKLLCISPQAGTVFWEFPHGGGGEYGAVCMVPVPIDEHRLFLDHKDEQSMVVQIERDGQNEPVKSLWEDRCTAKSYSAAVHHDGYIYGYNGRTLTCIDAKDGTAKWRSRQPGDGFPTIVDGHLVILTKDGRLHVARATPERYEEAASLKIFSDLAWGAPSFARGSIYVRSFGEIARIDVRSAPSPILARHDASPDVAGTRFADFLDRVRDANDKSATIDQFLSSTTQFPMIEHDGRVLFLYRGVGQDLAIGGDLTGFGDKLTMRRVPGTDLFYAVARLEPDARISYAFIRDFKVIPDSLNPRRATASGFDDDLELSFSDAKTELSWIAMPQWKPPDYLSDADESRRGHFESHKLMSNALDAQVPFDVYLPAGYKEMTAPLPVAYIHDGTFAHGPLRLPTALDNLIGRRVAPIIAVFINREPPFFKAEAYARMCAEEIPAFIDEHYRTIRSPDARGHVGWGAGGYPAMLSVLAHPNVANKLGAQSPWLVEVAPIEPVMKSASEVPLTIYLDWGKYDTRSRLEFWSIADMGRKLDHYFRDHGYRPMGGEAHDGAGVPSWQNRIDDLFEALFPITNPTSQRGQ